MKNNRHQIAEKFNTTWYTITFYKIRANGADESVIQSVKRRLYKTNIGTFLRAVELYLIITDIEFAIGNRPLTSLSERHNDNNIISLTLAHLLLGKKYEFSPRNLAIVYTPSK